MAEIVGVIHSERSEESRIPHKVCHSERSGESRTQRRAILLALCTQGCSNQEKATSKPSRTANVSYGGSATLMRVHEGGSPISRQEVEEAAKVLRTDLGIDQYTAALVVGTAVSTGAMPRKQGAHLLEEAILSRSGGSAVLHMNVHRALLGVALRSRPGRNEEGRDALVDRHTKAMALSNESAALSKLDKSAISDLMKASPQHRRLLGDYVACKNPVSESDAEYLAKLIGSTRKSDAEAADYWAFVERMLESRRLGQ